MTTIVLQVKKIMKKIIQVVVIVEVKAAANAPICLSRLSGRCASMNMRMVVGLGLG